MLPATIPVNAEPLPLTFVKTPLVAPILPTLALPLTDKTDNVPTLVMLGCTAVVTVPAVVAVAAVTPVNPDPLPVKILVPILILPKLLVIEPVTSAPVPVIPV